METTHIELFEAIPLPCLLLKPQGPTSFVIVDANKDYLEITGACKENLISNLSTKAFSENPEVMDSGNDLIHKSLQRVLKTGKRDKTGIVRYDLQIPGTTNFQERYWKSENTPLKDAEGKVKYILHTTIDVTQQVLSAKREERVQTDLSRKQQQFQHFIDENPDGLYTLDLEGNFITGNDGIAELAGVPLEKLLTLNFLPFCSKEDKEKILVHFQQALQGDTHKFEANFVSAKGIRRILEIHLAPRIINGEITGVHGIAKDLTTIKQTEKIVVEKRKFLEVNAAFISSLLENGLEDDVLEETFGIIGKTVEVDRMYYFGAETDKETNQTFISQKIEWSSEIVSAQKENPEMQNIPANRLEQIMGPLSRNTPFMANLSELVDSELRDIFLDQEIKSMLLLPIYVQGKLHGFIGFDDCQRERIWSDDETTFLQSLVHYFTNALEKNSAQRAVKEKEEELRRSEQKFKALVQEGSDLIAILDEHGNFQFTSETSSTTLGIAPDEFIGKRAFDYIHPEDQARIIAEFADLQHKKQKKTSPYRFMNKKGEWRWIETAATNLMDDPAVQGIVINSRDITTIMEQAREIEQINERYQLAATATQDLIYDWDLENDEVVRFHRSSQSMLGHSTEDLGKREFWSKHVHPEESQELHRNLRETLADPEKDSIKSEYRFRRADGSYAHLIDRGHIIRNSEGKAIRLIGATSDISEITSKKEDLKVANSRFKMAMKVTREMIWDWDIKANIVHRSKSFGKIYGYKASQKSSMENFWLPKIESADRKRITNSLQAALENPNQKEWKEEYRFTKADGKIAYVMDRGHIIRDQKGKPVRMVGAVLDVTSSRRLIKDIKKQNKGLKEIAWAQSHVVRAPLARLKGLMNVLELEDFEGLTRNEVIHHIHSSADELDEILKGIVAKTEDIEIRHQESEKI